MFNTEVKLNYIKYNPNNNHNFESVMNNYFSKAEVMEKMYGKDLATFTSAEILAMYKSFLTPSLNFLIIINNQFVRYTDWYMAKIENIDNQNHYVEIRNDMLIDCIMLSSNHSSILSRDELSNIVKALYNPYEQFTCFAYFEGFKSSDLYELKMTDFDVDKRIVELPGRTLSVSKELIHYAEQSSEEYETYTIFGEPTGGNGGFLPEDDRIIKTSARCAYTTSEFERSRIVYRIIQKLKRYDFVPRAMSATTLAESGRIELIRNLMKEHNIESPEEILRQFKEDYVTRYGRISSIPKWLLNYESFFHNS